MDDTTQKNDKPGLNDTEGYALELIERWRERREKPCYLKPGNICLWECPIGHCRFMF